MIFIIIEHFDFMILIQSMALSKTRVDPISKITVTSHTTKKLKTHFLRKFNDFFQIMNWIILKKSIKKFNFFLFFSLSKRKFFRQKNVFFHIKNQILEVSSFFKQLKIDDQNKNFFTKNLEKVEVFHRFKIIFSKETMNFLKFSFNQIYVKNSFFLKKKMRKFTFSKVIQRFDFWKMSPK